MTDHEFQLLMGRMTNQDETLQEIKHTLTPLVLKVDDHDHYINFARRVWKWGATVSATAVGAWLTFKAGWK